MATQPIPSGFHTVSPHLVIQDASAAIDFYARAFGAEEVERVPGPGGQGVMHATIRIGDSPLMLNDEFPDWGVVGPTALGGSPVTVHLYVEDVDALYQRAVDAGATVVMPLDDTFWGDRYAKLKDPYGHLWSIATHIKDMTPDEIAAAAAAAMAPQES